jgi:hypothetical protein
VLALYQQKQEHIRQVNVVDVCGSGSSCGFQEMRQILMEVVTTSG